MPETLNALLSRRFLASAVLLGGLIAGSGAFAQTAPDMQPPPPQGAPPMQAGPPVNPICPRLEAQLATIDRGGSNDPAKDEQIRRYQDAAAQQQSELDRVTMQAKRMGCESSGFFSLFSTQSAQCGSQRRSVLTALAQNSCGPQYANAAAAPGPGGFLNNLFGGNNNPAAPPVDLGPQSGTYRTVCVRTCDGGYFPVSFATVPARFGEDENKCKALCPATEATLYAYRNPGEDINQAVSVNGQPYTALPNAFKFRTEFNPTCSCRAPGQTWSDALKTIDEKAAAAEQGDIIVTEESAKKMQQRAQQPARSTQARKGATPPAQTGAPAPDAATPPPADTAASSSSADKPIRTVGPKFLQEKQGPSIPR
jgi:hypothetical protein